MTKNQEAPDLTEFCTLLDMIASSDEAGFLFRPSKLEAQFEKYGIDFLDVNHALKHRRQPTLCSGEGLRFQVKGPSIEGDELVITLTRKRGNELKIVNVWRN